MFSGDFLIDEQNSSTYTGIERYFEQIWATSIKNNG
jgi:hypothetical protein